MVMVIVRRVLLGVPTLLGVIVLLFVTMRMLPGDPVSALLGGAPATPETIAELKSQFGLGGSTWHQFVLFFRDAMHFDFGKSFSTRQPVSGMIRQQITPTLKLALAAAVVSAVLGIVLGSLAALFRDTWVDSTIRITSLLNTAMPSFWVGIILIYLLSFKVHVFPATGSNGLLSLVLPAFTLGLGAAGTVTRLVRNSVIEVLGETFVLALHAKGLRPRVVVMKHVLRNAVIPTITIVGFQLGALLGGAVIVETVFARQGLGQMLVQAIQSKDYPVVQGVVLVIATIYIVINIVVDISYSFVDPRIRMTTSNA